MMIFYPSRYKRAMDAGEPDDTIGTATALEAACLSDAGEAVPVTGEPNEIRQFLVHAVRDVPDRFGVPPSHFADFIQKERS